MLSAGQRAPGFWLSYLRRYRPRRRSSQPRMLFLQANPLLGKDLNEVAAKLQAELTPRTAELLNDGARLYASRFTEQELKDVLAFYKSPVGRKVITQEPAILDQSASNVDEWANKLADEVISKFRNEMRRRGKEI